MRSRAATPRCPPTSTQRFTLDKVGCTGGAAWCKTIQLDKDGSTKMFVVVAKNAAGVLAEGCATAVDRSGSASTCRSRSTLQPAGVLRRRHAPDRRAVRARHAADERRRARAWSPTRSAAPTAPRTRSCSPSTTPRTCLQQRREGHQIDLALSFGPGAAGYPNALRALFVDSDRRTIKGPSDIHERFLSRDLFAHHRAARARAPAQLAAPLRQDAPASGSCGAALARPRAAWAT